MTEPPRLTPIAEPLVRIKAIRIQNGEVILDVTTVDPQTQNGKRHVVGLRAGQILNVNYRFDDPPTVVSEETAALLKSISNPSPSPDSSS